MGSDGFVVLRGGAAMMSTSLRDAIEQAGFTAIAAALSQAEVHAIRTELEVALSLSDEGPIRRGREQIAASRNLLHLWPNALQLARSTAIRDAVVEVLGTDCGLVRALYFDKPPGRSWSIPWHKDMTIAVRDNHLAGTQFCKPTLKAGIPHVEAPESVLQRMLTARVHLDDVDESNGPLLVVPGSHQEGKTCASDHGDLRFRSVLVSAGDVLLIRPLVTHCSRHSRPGTQRHRRIIHLEFAAATPLPDAYQWYEFHSAHEEHAQVNAGNIDHDR